MNLVCRFVFDTDLQGEDRTPRNYLKLGLLAAIIGENHDTSISEENFGEVIWNWIFIMTTSWGIIKKSQIIDIQ